MTLERSRHLIGGVWQYVTASENGGGGSLPSGGTTGEVLTKESNADGDVGWEPSGGSVPGSVRRLTLGTIAATDLLDGIATLYTPDAGERVGPFYIESFEFCDTGVAVVVYDDSYDLADTSVGPPLCEWDNDLVHDSVQIAIDRDPLIFIPVAATPIKAALFNGIGGSQAADVWQANHDYGATPFIPACVIGSGHLWTTIDSGSSGGSTPDWAGNFGGTVVDGDLTWADVATVTQGEAVILADVTTPVAP